MEIAKMNDLFAEAMENLGFDGYVIPDGLNPVPGLNRRKKAYGLCSRKYNRYEQRFDYEITFSKYFIMGCTEKQFMTVAYHELIHAIADSIDFDCGHTGMWKVIANKVSEKYGVSITRTDYFTDENGKEVVAANSIANNQKTYIVRCTKCGAVIIHHRMCNIVKYPELFLHADDNGKFERIK